jgi:glucose/arabinose dehydrogenase
MIMRLFFYFIICLISTSSYATLFLNLLKLPPGFSIQVYAENVPDARSMTLGTNSIVFVGSREEGKVYALLPDAKTHTAKALTIASGLTLPNGVAFHNGSLYVAEMNRILRFDNIEANLNNPPKPVVITTNLPNKTHHGWRYLRIGPDNKLYISIGAPCNICLSDDARFATIARMNLDGSNVEIYAKGIRNSIGFDWNANQQFWFTNNGRDEMGDNIPPDELNYAPVKNLNYGFPYCHGSHVPDPVYGKIYPCSAFTQPTLELPAHVATLGMRFYTGNMFPRDYQQQIFIAEHGSWDRSKKVGYQVILVKLKDNKVIKVTPFVTGWLQQQSEWGRPVDVLVMRDGSLLISDDYANAIYRVTYNRPR